MCPPCVPAILTISLSAWGQPLSLLPNGSLEQPLVGWHLSPGMSLSSTSPHSGRRCLQATPDPESRDRANGSAYVELVGLKAGLEYTVVGWGRAEQVAPPNERPGYGYMAVYQYDAQGRLIAGGDFGQPRGTQGWTRYQRTFYVYEGAASVRLRCGLYNARGTAWFDDFLVVEGPTAPPGDKVREPAQQAPKMPGFSPKSKGNFAILRDNLEAAGTASDPDYLGEVLSQAGYGVAFLTGEQLAQPGLLSAEVFDGVVLPYGETFPRQAAKALISFLQSGGDFISLGGYAFNHLVGGEKPKPSPGDRAGRFDKYRNIQESTWFQDVPITPGPARRYVFSGWIRTEGVTGEHFAFLAVYQYDAQGKLIRWKDIVQLKGLNGWQRHKYEFSTLPETAKLQVKVGLYRCSGRAWFDDFSLKGPDGKELLTNTGFEEDFDPDDKAPGKWYRTQRELCQVSTAWPHAGKRCAQCDLHQFKPTPFYLNTARGVPADGLNVQPQQIGAFDADFKLRRVAYAAAAPGQFVVPSSFRLKAGLTGYVASAVLGNDDARRIALVNTFDRYGRPRGAVVSLVHRYGRFYTGSSWALFGADNYDLVKRGDQAGRELLIGVADRLVRETFLRDLKTNLACYRQGEAVKLAVIVTDHGREPVKGMVRFEVNAWPVGTAQPPADAAFSQERPVSTGAGESQTVEATWSPGKFAENFYRVRATLFLDGKPYDRMETGFVVWDTKALAQCAPVTFRDNFFRYGDRPQFLFGSDTYSFTFTSAHENPLVWRTDLSRMRDQGFNVNENLQGHYFEPEQELWRKIDALIQLSQEYDQVYMAGLLIGANVVVEDAELQRHAAWCRRFAERYHEVPGLIYYLNGDFRLNLKDGPDVRRLWNEFLRQKYGSDARLRASWGDEAPSEKLGELPVVDYRGQDWADLRAVDTDLFRISLLRRWVNTLTAAIREVDQVHPITSEFYRLPFNGIDLIQGIGNMDHSNIGYFDAPGKDIARLPATLRYHDLRSRGKGFGLGEYGVKTHPAWREGAHGYHPTRTLEQQDELFLAVHHYAFGLGAGKVQNWCWKDNVERIFPWGLVYPHNVVKKDVLDTHRATALLLHQFEPEYRPAKVFLLTPDYHRLGASRAQVYEATLRSADLLLACGVEFGVLNEYDLRIPPTAQVIFYPLPFHIPDPVYGKLLEWVKGGGTLFVSGDVSFDGFRKRTKTERLKELCGVEFVRENFPGLKTDPEAPQSELKFPHLPDTPAKLEWTLPITPLKVSNLKLEVEPVDVEAELTLTDADGRIVRVVHRLGRGAVHYSTWPVELLTTRENLRANRLLYAMALSGVQQRVAAGEAAAPGLRAMVAPPLVHQMRPSVRGLRQAVIVFDQSDRPSAWQVQTDARHMLEGEVTPGRGGLAFLSDDGKLLAAGVCGSLDRLGPDGPETLLQSRGQLLAFSLDGRTLFRSKRLALLPVQEGSIRLKSSAAWRQPTAFVGEVLDGRWVTYEKLALKNAGGTLSLEVDPDRNRTIIIVCEPADLQACSERLVASMVHPERRP